MIAIIDPASYSLPYDYYYINRISKTDKVVFYCSETKYNNEYIDYLNQLENVTVKIYRISSSSANKLTNLLSYFKLMFDVLINANKYQRIHFQWLVIPYISLLLYVFVKNKLVQTIHNPIPHNVKTNSYFPYILLFKLCKRIVAVSKSSAMELKKRYGVESVVMQHGIMPLTKDHIRIQNEDVPLIDTNLDVVFWGRVSKYKGIHSLPFDELKFRIEVVGKWDADIEMKPIENVKFINRYISLKELQALLSRECIFILPYLKATQSGVLYTLLAYNRVFIATNTGDLADFLKSNGLSNLLFDYTADDINRAYSFANDNYDTIKRKLRKLQDVYSWDSCISNSDINKIYYE